MYNPLFNPMKFHLSIYLLLLMYTMSSTVKAQQSEKNNQDKKNEPLISVVKAMADINEFQDILETKSSYLQLSDFNYIKALDKLKGKIHKEGNPISISFLTHELAKIMGEIGDRHSSIRNRSFDEDGHNTFNLKLPFGLAHLNNKIIAVKRDSVTKEYSYLHKDFPYIKSIDGIAIETYINSYNYRAKKAPRAAKLTRAAKDIQKFGELVFKNNKECPINPIVVFTDGKNQKTASYALTEKRLNQYYSKIDFDAYFNGKKMEKGVFNELSKIIGNNIGYINIPTMSHYDEVKGLEDFIKSTLLKFRGTKALIIDVRSNPGGGREILKTVAPYIISEKESPWVANVAYLRTDMNIDTDEKSMGGRYLYSYNSNRFTDLDRKAIDTFMKTYTHQRTFDASKFSKPFYMVLHHGEHACTGPVYILANERSFSAATVFTSAFKGLPNVKIVGETTDGSSGNSKRMYLKNSNIRVKISTMLSYQRNGKTLDGNGTVPDIVIKIDETQVLKGKDTQLEKLVKIIDGKKP